MSSQTKTNTEDIRALGKKQSSLAVRVKQIEDEMSGALVKKVTERIRALNRVTQIQCLKLCVVSEVARLYPKLWKKIIRALDKPDDWWSEKDHFTIKQWASRIESESHP